MRARRRSHICQMTFFFLCRRLRARRRAYILSAIDSGTQFRPEDMEGALEMTSFHTSLTTSNRWRSEETPGEGGEAATQAQATEGEPSAPSLYGSMPREVGMYVCVCVCIYIYIY